MTELDSRFRLEASHPTSILRSARGKRSKRLIMHHGSLVDGGFRKLKRANGTKSAAWDPKVPHSPTSLVLVRWQERTIAVSMSQLVATHSDESTAESIGDRRQSTTASESDPARRRLAESTLP